MQIELKAAEATESTVRLIERSNAEKEVIITSFMHELLRKAHGLNPVLRTGALFFDVKGDICQRAIDVHSEAIHVYYRNVDSKLVEEAHRRGLKVSVWNPDDVEDMRKMIGLNVDVIGTNRPDLLLSFLKEMGMR